jgi:hypothetical protein
MIVAAEASTWQQGQVRTEELHGMQMITANSRAIQQRTAAQQWL